MPTPEELLAAHAPRKCESQGCRFLQPGANAQVGLVSPRLGKKGEQIQLSNGHRDTVVWDCKCGGWKQIRLLEGGL